MRTQEFLDSHVQLVFTFWGLWTHKLHKNSYNMNRKGFFFPPNISVFWSKSRKIDPKNFDGKMLFKMKQLSLFLFFVTICQNFETVKIHFDPKLVLFVCCFFFSNPR